MKGLFRLVNSLWLFLLCLVLTPSVPRAASVGPSHFWSENFGGVGIVESHSVAVDGSGNAYITGRFTGTASFGGATFTSAGANDIFLAKYDANGVHVWSQRFGSTGEDQGLALAVDNAGSVLVTGGFQGTVNFGGSSLTSVGLGDIFLAKYNANGVHQWSRRFGDTGFEVAFGVAVDASGNVLLTGNFYGTVSFGGAILTSSGYVGGGDGPTDIFLAKYDANGVHQWSQRFGTGSYNAGSQDVAVDASGDVLITGYFRWTVNFGGSLLVAPSFSQDIFLAKFNPNGVHLWSQRFGGGNNLDSGSGVAVDASGNVLLTGHFTDLINFGGATLYSLDREFGPDVYLAKLNSAGVHQWSQTFPGTDASSRGLAVDASGNVVISGFFPLTINLGGSPFTSAGLNDIFIAKYSANGAHLWSRRFGNTGEDVGHDVAVDGSGNVLATGDFGLTVNFGGSPLTSLYQDVYLAKYGPDVVQPCILSIMDVGNDQGRRVRIHFAKSPYDSPAGGPNGPVTRYDVYRRNDALASLPPPSASSSSRALMDLGWVFAGDAPAHSVDAYEVDAPTDADSTISQGQHYSAFFVRAVTASPATFFDSPIDSGYSLDNLSPGVPNGFAYQEGQLSWDASSEKDFDHFTVWGSRRETLDAAAVVIERTAGNHVNVEPSPYAYYFVTATDRSGNEGRAARANGQSGGVDTPARYVLSVTSYPNPFNPATTIRYTVPSRGEVTISIYDARGQRVTTLVSLEVRDAGAYTERWDGWTDAGPPATSGIYFVRLEHGDAVRSQKVVLLK